jgi:transposase-like protein
MHDEAAAFAHVEAMLWQDGPVCPRCGVVGNAYVLSGVRSKPSKKNPEGVERHGLKKCKDCSKQFTVRKDTIFEESHIPLHKWLQAIFLMTSSKKGISSNQLHRTLGITLKSAWFLSHRVREAMRDGDLTPFGADGGFVEVDETFIGNDKDVIKAKAPKGHKKPRSAVHKFKVLSLVDRETGRARSIVVDDLKQSTLGPILRENIVREATLMTDELGVYKGIGKSFAEHHRVRHGMGEYVNRKNPEIHTNTIEGYFSIFKRGMKGVYQHCAKRHLHRYAAEFEFRYNHRVGNGFDDLMRASRVLIAASGKRLTYRDSFA